jgi:hypothetical protein
VEDSSITEGGKSGVGTQADRMYVGFPIQVRRVFKPRLINTWAGIHQYDWCSG